MGGEAGRRRRCNPPRQGNRHLRHAQGIDTIYTYKGFKTGVPAQHAQRNNYDSMYKEKYYYCCLKYHIRAHKKTNATVYLS